MKGISVGDVVYNLNTIQNDFITIQIGTPLVVECVREVIQPTIIRFELNGPIMFRAGHVIMVWFLLSPARRHYINLHESEIITLCQKKILGQAIASSHAMT